MILKNRNGKPIWMINLLQKLCHVIVFFTLHMQIQEQYVANVPNPRNFTF